MKPSPYNYAAALCARREYCAADIAQLLYRHKVEVDEIEAVVQRLIDERFIDHERYVCAFVNDKFRFAHWGRIKIRYALRQKGIDDNLINHAFDEMIREEDYEQAVKDFINARLKTTRGRTPYEVRQKVMRAALSRGYEMDYLHDIDMEDVD